MLGVRHQVDHHLLQLLAEPEDRGGGHVELGPQLHVVGPQHALADLRDVPHQLVELHPHGVGVAAARQAQQAAHDASGAVHLAYDGRGRGVGVRVAGGALEQLGFHADRGEGVVHLVGDAARDFPHGGQLLPRDQLALGPQLVGAVVEGHQHVVGAEAGEHGRGAVTDAAVAGGLGHHDPTVPGRRVGGAEEHLGKGSLAGGEAQRLDGASHRISHVAQPEHAAPRLVELLHPADAVDEGQRQRAAVHHRGRARRGLPRRRHRLGELETPRDVRGDGGEVVQLDQPERRGRLLSAQLQVADDPRRADDAGRGAERHDHRRTGGAGEVGRRVAVGLREDVLGVHSLAGAYDPAGDAGIERHLNAVHFHPRADGRHHPQRVLLPTPRRLAQRDVRALRLYQTHDALHGVAQHHVPLGGGEQPAGELDEEGAQAAVPLQAEAVSDHERQVAHDLGKPLGWRSRVAIGGDGQLHPTALGIDPLALAQWPGGAVPGEHGSGLPQPRVGEPHPRPAPLLAEDLSGGLPKDLDGPRGRCGGQ